MDSQEETDEGRSMEPDSPVDSFLPQPGVASQEVRVIQAKLFCSLVKRCLKLQSLETHREHLDIPISYMTCKSHWIDLTRLDKDGSEGYRETVDETLARFIIDGTCPCDPDNADLILRKTRFVTLAAGVESFLPVLVYLGKIGCNLGPPEPDVSLMYEIPLVIAVVRCQLDAVKFLLSQNVDYNLRWLPGEERPLWLAVSNGFDDMVSVLLAQSDIDLNLKSSRGYPLLHFCLRNYSRTFYLLLEGGANPNIVDNHMTSALMIAVSHRREEEVKALIQHGANVNQMSRRNEVPLIVAVYTGHARLVEVLLDSGADPNIAVSEAVETPLLHACFDGDIDIVRLLIKYKADVQKSTQLGYTPLHIAAWNGHTECVREIVKAGALHDIQTSDKNTPLALAAHGQHLPVIKELLPLGCDVNNADKDSDTPILYAAYNGMTRAVEVLLEYGADPNCCNRVGATPLWNAVYGNHIETVKLLLKVNVVMEQSSIGIDQHNQTDEVRFIFPKPYSPLRVAFEKKYTDIAEVLFSAGYNYYKEDSFRDFPLPENDRLGSLIHQCGLPPTLLAACRSQIRQVLGLGIEQKVKELDIPRMLKNYLTLADLTYTVNEPSEDGEMFENGDAMEYLEFDD